MGLFGMNRGAQNESTSVEREYKRAKIAGWRDTIICALVIVAVIFAKDALVGAEFAPVLDETQFSIMLPSGDRRTIVFDELQRVEYRQGLESFDRGELLSGEEARRCFNGVYKNAEFGEYELYVMTKLDSFIVAHLPDGIVLFNIESDDTTRLLYDLLETECAENFA